MAKRPAGKEHHFEGIDRLRDAHAELNSTITALVGEVGWYENEAKETHRQIDAVAGALGLPVPPGDATPSHRLRELLKSFGRR